MTSLLSLRGELLKRNVRLFPTLMRTLIPAVVMFLLTAFVLQTAVRIEVLNFQDASYLPRKDRNPDGTLAYGKWRVSLENSPRDQLRALVETLGLLQYLLAPLLLIFAIIVLLKLTRSWVQIGATLSLVASMIAMSLMLYREYYQSLGW
jgi:hypothetical protein